MLICFLGLVLIFVGIVCEAGEGGSLSSSVSLAYNGSWDAVPAVCFLYASVVMSDNLWNADILEVKFGTRRMLATTACTDVVPALAPRKTSFNWSKTSIQNQELLDNGRSGKERATL